MGCGHSEPESGFYSQKLKQPKNVGSGRETLEIYSVISNFSRLQDVKKDHL